MQAVHAPTMPPLSLYEVVGAHPTLDLIPPDIIDQPLLVLCVVELVCHGGQIELEVLRDELAELPVVVVPAENGRIRSVGDQVDVHGAVAKGCPLDPPPS